MIALRYNRGMPLPSAAPDPLDGLTAHQREWALESERRWQRARELARRYPTCDVSDLYHALRSLALTPSQRLAAGLQRGRLRAHGR